MKGWSGPAKRGIFSGGEMKAIIAEVTAVRKVCHVSRKVLLGLVQVIL